MKHYYKVTYESGYVDYMYATSIAPIISTLTKCGIDISVIIEIKRLKQVRPGIRVTEIGRREN